MFTANISPYGSFECLHITNGKQSCKIIPDFGANLMSLQLEGKDKIYELLDRYENTEAFQAHRWSKSDWLIPYPNRIKDGKYTYEGTQYHFELNHPRTESSIHGFCKNKKFDIKEIVLNEDFAQVDLFYNYNGNLNAFPFPFEVNLQYILSKNNSLEIYIYIKNTGENKMPAGIGWHPYFKWSENIEVSFLQMPACNRVEVDHNLIPVGGEKLYDKFLSLNQIGETKFDNCFHLAGNAPFKTRLTNAEKSLQVELQTDKNFPYLQVFIPPDRHCIALEPMTCNVNAFNNKEGLKILSPGENFGGKISVSLQEIAKA